MRKHIIMRYTTRLTLLGLVACASVGCRKQPIIMDAERTQFDRYDAIRNQYAEPYLFDEFGRRQPNLRARLLERN